LAADECFIFKFYENSNIDRYIACNDANAGAADVWESSGNAATPVAPHSGNDPLM